MQNVEQPKTTDAENSLYTCPLLNDPNSKPTNTAASMRAILKVKIHRTMSANNSEKTTLLLIRIPTENHDHFQTKHH